MWDELRRINLRRAKIATVATMKSASAASTVSTYTSVSPSLRVEPALVRAAERSHESTSPVVRIFVPVLRLKVVTN